MKHTFRVITHWALLIHIYVSMAGFTLVLLFAVTGLTLNHQDFGLAARETTKKSVEVPASLVQSPDRSALTKHFEESIGIRSPLTDYREDETEVQMTFAAPGRRSVVTIDRATRTAEVDIETRGPLGRLDDLHKGLDSGRPWYWVIDITAILLTISSLTGMITLFSLRARRRSGFVVGGIGILTVVLIYALLVPK
jgi:uncharacterized protein